MIDPRRARRAAVRLAALALFAAPGCSTYVIQGKAIEGEGSDMSFVEPGDPRLDEPGISGVRLSVERDPGSLGAKVVANEVSGAAGEFSIPLSAFGAGWMVEEWRIHAVRGGFQTASRRLNLTGADRKRYLLVTLAPGASDDPQEPDLMEQYERFR